MPETACLGAASDVVKKCLLWEGPKNHVLDDLSDHVDHEALLLGVRVSGFGFRVSGLGFRVYGSGFRVWGFLGIWGFGTNAGPDPGTGPLPVVVCK